MYACMFWNDGLMEECFIFKAISVDTCGWIKGHLTTQHTIHTTSFLHPSFILSSFLHPSFILPSSILHPYFILSFSFLHPYYILSSSILYPSFIFLSIHSSSFIVITHFSSTFIHPSSLILIPFSFSSLIHSSSSILIYLSIIIRPYFSLLTFLLQSHSSFLSSFNKLNLFFVSDIHHSHIFQLIIKNPAKLTNLHCTKSIYLFQTNKS